MGNLAGARRRAPIPKAAGAPPLKERPPRRAGTVKLANSCRMPSMMHQAIAELIRTRPEMLLHLLGKTIESEPGQQPAFEVLDGTFDQLVPTEYRSDAVIVMHHGGRPPLGLVGEVQLSIDPDKLYSWPVYASTLRNRLRCGCAVVVVCIDGAVAQWAARPISLGPGGAVFLPLVIGPAAIPEVVHPSLARGIPEIAVMSVMAHARSSNAERIAFAALETFGGLGGELARLYYDLIWQVVPDTVKRALEEAMLHIDPEFDSPAVRTLMARGEARGRARGLLAVLDVRGLLLSDDQRTRVLACTDIPQLERWNARAAVATSVDEVFAE